MLLNLEYSTVYLLPYAVCLIVLLMPVLYLKKHSLSYILFAFIFGIYLLAMLDNVIFPVYPFQESDWRYPRIPSINLIPFNYSMELPHVVFADIVLNVILTIPFGFGMNFLARFTTRRALWTALAVGLTTEGLQLAMRVLGLNAFPRGIDITDVINNALGVVIGYGLFRLFAWLYSWAWDRLGLKPGGLADYVYQVCRRPTT